MKTKLLFIFTALLFVLVLVLLYLNISKSVDTPVLLPLPTPTQTESFLNIYTNSTYHFSAKYNPDWIYLENSDSSVVKFSSKSNSTIDIHIEVKNNPENLSLDKWLSKNIINLDSAKYENVTVDNNPALRIDNFFFVARNNYIYQISFVNNNPKLPGDSDFEIIIGYFINNFMFTDTLTSWQKYVDQVVSLEYPSQFTQSVTNGNLSLHSPSNNNIYISTDKNSSSTITEYLAKKDKESLTSWEGMPSIQVLSTKKTLINNLSVIQRDEWYLAADMKVTNTYFKKGSQIVIVSFNPTPGNNTLLDKEIYNQILNTFSFSKVATGTQTIKLYFHDAKLDPNTLVCEANNYINVNIPKSSSPIRDTLNTLIKNEIFEQHPDFYLKNLNLKTDGTLVLEFPEVPSFTTGGSCRINLLTSQIIETALQFKEVNKVVFSPEVFQP